MALVFTEEFETTLGTTPTGWTLLLGGPVCSTGGYRNQCCRFDPVSQIARKMPGSYGALTIFFVGSPHAAQGSPLELAQSTTTVIGTSTTTSYVPFLTVRYGGDTSLEVIDNAGNVACSGVNAFDYKGFENPNATGSNWSFIQLDATFSATTIGTASAIKCVANLHCWGESIGVGTTTFLSSLAATI